MDPKSILVLVFQIAIIGTVFGYGLKATVDDILYVVRHPGLLLRSFLSVMVIMPVLAVLLVKALDLPFVTEVLLVALAISPIPPLLLKRESKAAAHTSYGLGLIVVLALVSIVVTPLAVVVLHHVFGRPLTASPAVIARIVIVLVVLPLVAGMLVSRFAPTLAETIANPVRWIANGLLLLGVVVMLAVTWRALWSTIGQGTVLAIVAFLVVGLLVGHLLGGPDRNHASVLALSTAGRHPGICFALMATNFPDERFGAPLLLYLLLSAAVAFPYVRWQRKRAGTPALDGKN